MKLFQKTIFWLIVILIFSFLFRLSNLDLVEFKSDEATTVYQTVLFFEQPYLIQRGLISGTGVYNFPLFNYLMIVLSVWTRDPLVLSGLIAFINSLLVVLFFFMVKKYYSLFTAILASLLLACSPWGVLFSRKIWAQDLINLFLIPFLFLLHELILRKNDKVILPLFIFLSLLIQLHGSGFFIFAVIIIIFIIVRTPFNFRYALTGLLIGLIPIVPYVLFQITSYPKCPDCESLIKYQQSFRIFDFNNFLRPFQTISGLGYHFVLGRNYEDFISNFPIINMLKYVFASGFPVVLAGIVFILMKNKKYLFLVLYFVAVPAFYFITRTPAYMHYFVIIIPVNVLLFAISLSSLYSLSKNKLLRVSVMMYIVLFLISDIAFLTFFYKYLGFRRTIEGDYGPIYSLTKSLIEKETKNYSNLPEYEVLKSYANIWARSDNLQTKIKEFRR